MDFDLANQYAKEISQGKDEQRHEELVTMCVPYLLYLKKRLGFHRIMPEEVNDELASDAIMAVQRRKLPFTICLQNTFRDLCRKRVRITREHDSNNIVDQCDIRLPGLLVGVGTPPPSPPTQSQDNELIKLAENILKDHEDISTKVVYQKTRGSTYPEMSVIFKTTSNECKKVYWHDINDLREKLNPNPEKD